MIFDGWHGRVVLLRPCSSMGAVLCITSFVIYLLLWLQLEGPNVEQPTNKSLPNVILTAPNYLQRCTPQPQMRSPQQAAPTNHV